LQVLFSATLSRLYRVLEDVQCPYVPSHVGAKLVIGFLLLVQFPLNLPMKSHLWSG